MAVVKTNWYQICLALALEDAFYDGGEAYPYSLLENLDRAFESKYEDTTYLAESLQNVSTFYFNSDRGLNLWSELKIYSSSFKIKVVNESVVNIDVRISNKIIDNLIRYSIFFKKMIVDEGLQRKLLTSKEYTHNNTSDSGDKNVYSETPQLELDNFEEAINYASNLSKSDLHNESEQTGDSTETVTSTSWEEGLRNLRFAFYNDLIDYINSIPNLIYSYYSLDSLPAPELVKANREYLKAIREL